MPLDAQPRLLTPCHVTRDDAKRWGVRGGSVATQQTACCRSEFPGTDVGPLGAKLGNAALASRRCETHVRGCSGATALLIDSQRVGCAQSQREPRISRRGLNQGSPPVHRPHRWHRWPHTLLRPPFGRRLVARIDHHIGLTLLLRFIRGCWCQVDVHSANRVWLCLHHAHRPDHRASADHGCTGLPACKLAMLTPLTIGTSESQPPQHIPTHESMRS